MLSTYGMTEQGRAIPQVPALTLSLCKSDEPPSLSRMDTSSSTPLLPLLAEAGEAGLWMILTESSSSPSPRMDLRGGLKFYVKGKWTCPNRMSCHGLSPERKMYGARALRAHEEEASPGH